MAAPLYALTRNIDFSWYDKCDIAFVVLKKLVSKAPVLRGQNWELPFHISMNTLDVAIGTVLGQEEDEKPYDVYYIIKNLTPIELNYTVIKKVILSNYLCNKQI